MRTPPTDDRARPPARGGRRGHLVRPRPAAAPDGRRPRRGPGGRARRARSTCRSRRSIATCGRSASSASSIATAASSGSVRSCTSGPARTSAAERLIRHADAALRMLVQETGETAVVVRRIGLSCVCLHQVESDEALRVTLEPGDDVAALRRRARAGSCSRSPRPRSSTRCSPRICAGSPSATPTEDELRAGLGGDRHDRDGHERRRADRRLGGDRGAALPRGRDRRGDRRSSARRSAATRRGGRGPAGSSRRRPGRSTRPSRRTRPR